MEGWGGRFPARSPTVPWTGRPWVQGWVESRLRPDPIVRNAPTIPRGIRLATRGRTFHRGQPEGWRQAENDPGWGQNPPTDPTLFPPITGKRVGRPAPPGLPVKPDPRGLGRVCAGIATHPSNQAHPPTEDEARSTTSTVGGVFWAHPPSLPSHPFQHALYGPKLIGRQGYEGREGWAGGLGWGRCPTSWDASGGCSVPGPALVHPM